MDVRCDRCQTEYELDDESVTDAGASVQCTTCGYTFVVSKGGAVDDAPPVTPPSGLELTSPSAPDWVLATEQGKTHRFRDLTTLQKWIVERRVTRGDRVCQRGGAWRRLGEVEELRPFFEVVEQADRAAATARGGREQDRITSPRHPGSSEDHEMYATGRRPRGSVRESDAFATDFATDDDLEAVGFGQRRRKLKVAGGVGIGLVAAAAAYVMFKDPHGFFLGRKGEASSSSSAVPVATAPPRPAPAAPPAAAPPPAPAAPAVPPAPVAAAPAAAPIPTAPAPAPAPAEDTSKAASSSSSSASASESRPRTYERLVAEADRALENGNTGKAQRLYDEALALQPGGVAATTGSAYLLLDRQKPLAAISLFKRALVHAPTFPPAIFGLAEAYRAQGDPQRALETYRRYLTTAPSGEDAPAARRQIRDLEAAAPAAAAPSAPTPEEKTQ